MKVLVWNLGVAWGRWRDDPALHERAWQWIAAVDPDIALLQETLPPDWATSRWSIKVGPHEFFASSILTRPELTVRSVTLPVAGVLEQFGSYLATCELELADESWLLLSSVHTSAREAPPWGHPGFERSQISRPTVGEPWWNDVAFAGFRELLLDRPFLIAGDWNTARYPDPEGVPMVDGQAFFDRAEAAGWVDISLDAEGHEGKTWYGSGNARPYQPDHSFANDATAALVRDFAIEPWPVVALGLSDHAPMLFELDIAPKLAEAFAYRVPDAIEV